MSWAGMSRACKAFHLEVSQYDWLFRIVILLLLILLVAGPVYVAWYLRNFW
jgi:hypothetical protein